MRVLRSGYVVADEIGSRHMTDAKADRDGRLKAALRENLKRRKAQARGRGQAGHDPAAVPGEGQGTPAGPDKRGARG